MPNGEGGSPPVELSERDKEMLGHHAESLRDRAAKSVGSPRDVKRGDRADMVGRGSRHDSHPIGNEKIPLK